MISVRSIRFRLLAALNTAMVLLLGVFLILDYRREIDERIAEKHVALGEEAQTLLPAVRRMQPYGEKAVQRYIDEVCARMQDASSPGHHIAVRLDDLVLQAVAHRRASPEIFKAMTAAASSLRHRADFGHEELVVGSSRQARTIVYVSEYLSSIRQAARTRALHRLSRIVLLVVLTAIVVNVVFLRMAARPLRELVDTVRKIANGQLGARAGPLGSEEFDFLAEAINAMSASLAETERHRRLEMDRARRIQEQLLPGRIEVPGLRFAHLYRPAEDVAGDYYDMIPLAGGACLVAIADVTGHGVPAALSAAMLKAYLQDASERHGDPREILRFLNYRLAGISQTDNFITMGIVLVDSDRNTLRYASAGHESGLLVSADGQVSELPSTGLVLGILEHADWTTETLPLGLGDRLLLVTDGLTEAMSPEEQMFGRERLVRTFQAGQNVPIQECVERIGRSVTEHCGARPPSDDITLLALEITQTCADEQGNRQML